MIATAEDVITTLKSIDASLKALVRHFGCGVEQGPSHTPQGLPNVATIASEADLDSKYGDPEVRAKAPKDWTGEEQKGKRFSECPPTYLDLLAARFDYFAGREEDPTKARYNRLDASRARGWAQRLRNGWKPAQSHSEPFGGLTSDDIAF